MRRVAGAIIFSVVAACASPVRSKLAVVACATSATPGQADPWTSVQLVEAEELARELSANKGAARPIILYVGFRTLFIGGHIPGAQFHGTASTEAGIAGVKEWSESLPKNTNLVMYCGCCPFDKCPNIHPAFVLLRNMGFTRIRVLRLPTSFAADWAEKNHPIEKGLRTE